MMEKATQKFYLSANRGKHAGLGLAIALLLSIAGEAHCAWLHGHHVEWDQMKPARTSQDTQWIFPDVGDLQVGSGQIQSFGEVQPLHRKEGTFRFDNIDRFDPDGEILAARGAGSGFRLRLPAETYEQVLRLYLSLSSGRLLIKGKVSGGGAHRYANITFRSRNRPGFRCYTFNYCAARDGEELELELSIMHQNQPGAELALHALALYRPLSNHAPEVHLTSPQPHSTFQAPATISVEAKVKDNGKVSGVLFFDRSRAIKLGEASTPPFRINVERESVWSGSVCAHVFDEHGRWNSSEPVRYTVTASNSSAIQKSEPLFTGFPSKGLSGSGFEAASSLAELPNGDLMVIWYSGRHELASDVKVFGSTFSTNTKRWSPPRIIVEDENIPLGNAVLLYHDGTLWCFYVKLHGLAWEFARLFHRRSFDLGKTWGNETPIDQPDFKYPTGTIVSTRPLVLANGDLLLPANRESFDPDPVNQWYSLFYISSDGGMNWRETSPLYSQPGNIQPAVEQLKNGNLIAYFRPRGQNHSLWKSHSTDNGRTWSDLSPSGLQNPSARVAIGRLGNGKLVMAYNSDPVARTPLTLALSEDDGATWKHRRHIETGGYVFTYPSLLVASDGTIHVTYDDNRHRIKHAIVDESWFYTKQ